MSSVALCPPSAVPPSRVPSLPELRRRRHDARLLLHGEVERSKGSHPTAKPQRGFLPKGHQLLGAVRMIRQPGLRNKEDIQANNFPLSSSELDVSHAFPQGSCQGLFAPLTRQTLEGTWLEALL